MLGSRVSAKFKARSVSFKVVGGFEILRRQIIKSSFKAKVSSSSNTLQTQNLLGRPLHSSIPSMRAALGTPRNSPTLGILGTDSASGPRLGGGLVANLLGNGVRLAAALSGVDKVDDIRSDRCPHNVRQRKGVGSTIGRYVRVMVDN
ncbi:hypothetical protein F0562_005769 [Nyssa sinensis]|uniref:Uncharacterized protein n=1 Tax=Nyssa sinensis TaxID=561372 RepID=A0A5J5AK92_9ASTE|nr:hypothetical protein F0562_005769 [Nyssa sinensis]